MCQVRKFIGLRSVFCAPFAYLFIAFAISYGRDVRHDADESFKLFFQSQITCIMAVFGYSKSGCPAYVVGLTKHLPLWNAGAVDANNSSRTNTQMRQLATRKMGPFGCREKSSAPTKNICFRCLCAAFVFFSLFNKFHFAAGCPCAGARWN